MASWIDYLRRGLSRTQTKDRVANKAGDTSTRANLENLRPFLKRHWRKGLLCVALILFTGAVAAAMFSAAFIAYEDRYVYREKHTDIFECLIPASLGVIIAFIGMTGLFILIHLKG